MYNIEKIIKIVTDDGCTITLSDYDGDNVEINVQHPSTSSPYFPESSVIIPKEYIFDVGKMLHEEFDE